MTAPPRTRADLVLSRTDEEVFEPDAVTDAPLVRFVAYLDHEHVFGWVHLAADRLTDLLNAHDELHLADAQVESLDDGVAGLVDELVLQCRDIIAVVAAPPRGAERLRRRTRRHALAIRSGSYLIGGHLHVSPGADPLVDVMERAAVFPLTDAWIEYWSGGERRHESTGTILVNRERTDSIRLVTDDDLADGGLLPWGTRGPTA